MHILNTGVSFVQAIPTDHRRVFPSPAPIYGLPRSGPIVPEIRLYIVPTLTVYAKGQGLSGSSAPPLRAVPEPHQQPLFDAMTLLTEIAPVSV